MLILKVPCGTLYVLKTAQNYGPILASFSVIIPSDISSFSFMPAAPKEVVSTSVKQFIDFLDDVGHAHKSISLFLEGHKRNKKIPKASFSRLKLNFGDFYFFHEQSRKSIA